MASIPLLRRAGGCLDEAWRGPAAPLRRAASLLLSLALLLSACGVEEPLRLLHASYDPTRELYHDINTAFALEFRRQEGRELRVQMSHGGSGKQTRAILDGLPADVVSLALPWDMLQLEKAGLLQPGWDKVRPHGSCPYYSTIVFLVRSGNPKGVHGWDDLLRPDVKTICANPKTSGGARCAYLAAWAWGLPRGSAAAEALVASIFGRAPVLDAGARAATTSFVERGLGDVLLTWENEAWLAKAANPEAGLEIVVPSQSLRCPLPVAVVLSGPGDPARRRLAERYVDYLFTPPAQALAARHHFRPWDDAQAERAGFPRLKLVSVEALGAWPDLQAEHFAAGGRLDRILEARR